MSTSTAPKWVATLISRNSKDTTQFSHTTKQSEAQIQDSFLKLLKAESVIGLSSLESDNPSYKSLHKDAQKDGLRMDLTFEAPKDPSLTLEKVRRSESLGNFETRTGIDIILQENTDYRKHKKLIVFDMDSTLIQQEVIDEIAAFVGVKAEVAVRYILRIIGRGKKGSLIELDVGNYRTSYERRVGLFSITESTCSTSQRCSFDSV